MKIRNALKTKLLCYKYFPFAKNEQNLFKTIYKILNILIKKKYKTHQMNADMHIHTHRIYLLM